MAAPAPESRPPRAGGQALADGVFMRTERAWAIARADGTVETGEIPPNRYAKIPVVRILSAMGKAMALGIGKGLLGRREKTDRAERGRKANRRFLAVMVGLQLAILPIALFVDPAELPLLAAAGITVAVWVVVLGALRVASPASLWRYHGAEHKAVTALETGVDLRDTDAVLACSRIHPRCGTNLVFIIAAASTIPLPIHSLLQPIVFLLMFAVAAELLSWASARPEMLFTRVLLAGGRFLQRHLTTTEPSREEQAVGCAALMAAVEADAEIRAREAAPQASSGASLETAPASADEQPELAVA